MKVVDMKTQLLLYLEKKILIRMKFKIYFINLETIGEEKLYIYIYIYFFFIKI